FRAAFGPRLAFDIELIGVGSGDDSRGIEGKRGGKGDGLNTRERTHARTDAVHELANVVRVVARKTGAHAHGDEAVRSEAGVDALQLGEAANHEARAGKKNDGNGHLRDHQ